MAMSKSVYYNEMAEIKMRQDRNAAMQQIANDQVVRQMLGYGSGLSNQSSQIQPKKAEPPASNPTLLLLGDEE